MVRFLVQKPLFIERRFNIPGFAGFQALAPAEQETGDSSGVSVHHSSGFPAFH